VRETGGSHDTDGHPPLGEAIERVPGIQSACSTASRSSSEFSARLAWDTDMVVALQRIPAESQHALQGLPAGKSSARNG